MVVVILLFLFWLALNGRFAAYAKLVTVKGNDDYAAALNYLGTLFASRYVPGYMPQPATPPNAMPQGAPNLAPPGQGGYGNPSAPQAQPASPWSRLFGAPGAQ